MKPGQLPEDFYVDNAFEDYVMAKNYADYETARYGEKLELKNYRGTWYVVNLAREPNGKNALEIERIPLEPINKPVQEQAVKSVIEQEQQQTEQPKAYRQRTIVDSVINTSTQLDPQSFPHLTESGKIKATIDNLAHLFASYGIKCQYDEILKKQIVSMQTASDNDLSETSTYAQIKSLLALNNAPISCVDLIPSVMAQNVSNPIVEWITSVKWDKHDYIGQLLNSLTVADDELMYKNKAVVTWLIQCVAAADSARSTPRDDAKPKFELVLVLQGGQGLKKTSWIQSLLPREMSQYVIDGAHLDPSDKDTVIKCISGWICELGELDATFRKADIARLKAFLSNQTDVIRLPYDRVSSNFKRRTSFCASVNPNDFLTDSTGARRFLPLAITNCNHQHNINLQQLWAQVWDNYIGGSQWWCTTELETMLESRHDKHSETSSISELINDKFDVSSVEKGELCTHYSITKVLTVCGIPVPTNTQIKQAKDFLEKKGFSMKALNGYRGYWLNMK
jgi:putative DNA primase/helicase